MKKINLKNAIWKEDKHFVAWNLNASISSFGDMRKEALKLYFEDSSITNITKVERSDIVSPSLTYA